MSWGKKASAIAIAAGLAACQSPDRATTIYYDQANRPLPQPLTVVHTGADGNGTPLLTLVGQYDPRGGYRLIYGGTGEDYFAGFSRGGLAGAFEGAGIAGFGALVRPAKTVFSNVGNSRATGGSATGGAGGVASASSRARGGNASAVARQGQSQSQHQNATATSDAAATTGPVSSSSTSGGGIIPNGTILHTPSGDIRVDPTVSVSQ